MFTFTRSQMKGAAFSGFILGITLMLLAACAPTVEPTPVPTDTPQPPRMTFTRLLTHTPYPTFTPFPSFTPDLTRTLEARQTSIVATLTAEVDPSYTPTEGWTTLEYPYYLAEVLEDTVLRELCTNKKGEYMFNSKGYPLVFECIYSVDGTTSGRIKYVKGDQLMVYAEGDQLFTNLFGGKLTAGGNAKIRTDGAYWYYMVAGPRGDTYLIDVRHVEILGLHK